MAWLNVRHFEKTIVTQNQKLLPGVAMEYDEIAGPVKTYSRNVFIAVAGFALIFILAGTAYYKTEKKKTQLQAGTAIYRVNEELQLISAEREQIMTSLDRQRNLLRSIVAAIPYGVFWKDRNLVFRGCNKNFAKIAGAIDSEDIIGKTDYDIAVDEEQADFLVKCDKEVMKTTIPLLNMEQQHLRSDGTVITLLVSKVPLRDTKGSINGILGIYVDVTELKQARQDVEDELSKFSGTIARMEEGVVVTNPQGIVTEVNPYFTNLVDRSRQEVLGKPIFDCISGQAGTHIKDVIENFRQTNVPESHVIFQAIDRKDFKIKIQPIYRNSKYSGVVLNIIDVSDLVEAKQQAEYINYTRSKFLVDMSHEIGTCMNSIMGFSELLTQEQLTPEQTKFVETIYKNAENLSAIIDRTGQLQNNPEEKLCTEKTEVTLESFLELVSQSVQTTEDENEILFNIDISEDVPATIYTDKDVLQQVLITLAGNAIELAEQTQVTLTLRTADVIVKQCSGNGQLKGICFALKYTGHRPQLEDGKEFADLSNRHKDSDRLNNKSAVTQLSIARKLVAKLDSRLNVQDYPAGVHELFFVIPYGNTENPALLEQDAGEDHAIEDIISMDTHAAGIEDHLHVLVVDDIPENRMLVEVMLNNAGYEVTLCSNGKEAVELAGKHDFDLILMDIQMDVMDGLEATKIIKSQGLNAGTAIMAMTASIEKGDEVKCFEAGCEDCLFKPIKKELLLRKVHKFVQQARQIKNAAQGGSITSLLTNNPDYHKTIDMFVNNLPGRIEEMQNALDKNNLNDLAFSIHALKGLGGFAGFPIYTEKAKSLEKLLKDKQIDNIQKQLDEMTKLCLRTVLASQ
jgi:PAS domain S-box-containing protein